MKTRIPYLSLLLCPVVLTGCTSTFMGSVFVFTFSNIISYILIGLFIALFISFSDHSKTWRRVFWLWFILNLVLTPLPGFIYLVAKLIGRSK